MTTAALIRKKIEATPKGQLFTPKEFLQFGTRAAVDQTLYRMVKQGEITRVARGIFVCPKESKYVGAVPPSLYEVAKSKARKTGATIAIHGAEAARMLGLSTQMQVQPVFYTTGRSAHFEIGKMTVMLKHKTMKKLKHAGTKIGLAVSAIWYLGRENVTSNVIAQIEQNLKPEEFKILRTDSESLPGWMMDKFYLYETLRSA